MKYSEEELKEAEKVKLLAEFYGRLDELEEAFERLNQVKSKLMFAENAQENFESYYKFVAPVSRNIVNIKNLAKLSRNVLEKYRKIDDSRFIGKLAWSSSNSSKSSKSTPFDDLGNRVKDLEFKVDLIIAISIAIFVGIVFAVVFP